MLNRSYLFGGIQEQFSALECILTRERATIQALANGIKAQGITYVILAGRYAKYVLTAKNRLTLGTRKAHALRLF